MLCRIELGFSGKYNNIFIDINIYRLHHICNSKKIEKINKKENYIVTSNYIVKNDIIFV